MKKDIQNVCVVLALISLGTFGASHLYARQIEREEVAYQKELQLESFLAEVESREEMLSLSEEVAGEKVMIVTASSTVDSVVQETKDVVPVIPKKSAPVVVQSPVVDVQAQADALAQAAVDIKKEEERIAAEKAAAERAATLATEKKVKAEAQAAAKKASRKSRAS